MAAPGSPGDLVVMGAIAAPHGVRGALKIRTHTADAAALLGYASWWVHAAAEKGWKEYELLGGRVQGGALVAQLAGVANREAALALRGRDIAVSRARMPAAPPGEIYWADLVGMAVIGSGGAALGSVAAVEAHGAHPLLRVTRGEDVAGGPRLIPYVAAIVTHVDQAARRIEVDWAEDY